MKLEEQLEESGYNAAVRELEEFKRARDFVRRNLEAGTPANVPISRVIADLADLEFRIKGCEEVLAKEYVGIIASVDARNDLDFEMADLMEHAELVAEYFDETGRPEMAEWCRALMRGDNPGPPPTPKGQDQKNGS
jgi:hypothetical protein